MMEKRPSSHGILPRLDVPRDTPALSLNIIFALAVGMGGKKANRIKIIAIQ